MSNTSKHSQLLQTIGLVIIFASVARASEPVTLPPLAEPVTSFGAAILDGQLYVYGGHKGRAHKYSVADQSNSFRRLDLSKPGEWKELPSGPRLQGLALIAHGGRLYRIGGFTAKNKEGEDQDLHSQTDFAVFDPRTNKWSNDLPQLPEPRSSFDAVLIDDQIYVAGGWNMHGGSDTEWHETAWSIDLAAPTLEWKPLAKTPFLRRALALGAVDGKVFVVGGMQQEGGPTGAVSVYDPKENKWMDGPALAGEDKMKGFGSSAFAVNGQLYASTFDGSIQRLSKDHSKWEVVSKVTSPRFFHRMLPFDRGLLILGGASMTAGKIGEMEVIRLP